MIRDLREGDLGALPAGRIRILRETIDHGFPVLSTLVTLPGLSDALGLRAAEDEGPWSLRPEDRETTAVIFEFALRQEWRMLRQDPSVIPGLPELIGGGSGGGGSDNWRRPLIRSAGADPFATYLVYPLSRFQAALHSALAASRYETITRGNAPVLTITAVPESAEFHHARPDSPGLQDLPYWRYVTMLEQNWGITSSVWAVGAGKFHLVDVGVPELDLTDPWGLGPPEAALEKTEASDDRLLAARALLGRIYNRVMRTQGPFDWLAVAGGLSTKTESLFLGACDALWLGSGSRILSLSRRAFARPLAETPFGETEGRRGARRPHPGVQQLIGRCGHAGRAEGVVHHAGSPAPEDGYVLVCEQLGPMHRPELERAVAVVTGKGAILDDGVSLARQSDLPLVYRVTDAWSLPEGTRVSVDAALGLVTRRPEG